MGSSHGQSAWRAELQVVVCAQSEDRQPDANREGAEARALPVPGLLVTPRARALHSILKRPCLASPLGLSPTGRG